MHPTYFDVEGISQSIFICLPKKKKDNILGFKNDSFQRAQYSRHTMWRFLHCRFWGLFCRLRVHLGHIRLGMSFSGIMFGLQGRISFPSVRIYVLISVSGFNSRHVSHRLLMAGRPLKALRSIWQTENPLVRSWRDNGLLCLLWHRNTFGPISNSLQVHRKVKYRQIHQPLYQLKKLFTAINTLTVDCKVGLVSCYIFFILPLGFNSGEYLVLFEAWYIEHSTRKINTFFDSILLPVWVLLCNNFVVAYCLTHLHLRPLKLHVLYMFEPGSRIHILNTRGYARKPKRLNLVTFNVSDPMANNAK